MLLARSVVVGLSLATIGFFILYMWILHRVEQQVLRFAALILLVVIGIALLQAQLHSFEFLTSYRAAKDPIVRLILIIEGIACIAIVFTSIRGQSRHARP
jgi:predicted tellurium resistance membrane protein TerC